MSMFLTTKRSAVQCQTVKTFWLFSRVIFSHDADDYKLLAFSFRNYLKLILDVVEAFPWPFQFFSAFPVLRQIVTHGNIRHNFTLYEETHEICLLYALILKAI